MREKKHLLIPGLLLFIAPWFIKAIVYVQPDSELAVYRYFNAPLNIEFFNGAKARLLLVAILLMAIQFLYLFLKHKITLKFHKSFILLAIFFLAIYISALMSPYQDTVYMGLANRFQGVYVYGYYMILAFLIYQLTDSESDILFLLKCLMFSVVPVFVIAFLQGFDINIPLLDGMRVYHKMGTQDMYHYFIDEYISNHQENINEGFNKTSATLYNPNYVGVYSATLTSLGFMIYLFKASDKKAIVYGGLTVLAFNLLFLSGSKTGFYIIVLMLFIVLIIVLKAYKNQLKYFIRLLLICVVSTLILNIAYSGGLYKSFFPQFYPSEEEPIDNGSKYVESITFLEDRTIIKDEISEIVLLNEGGKVVLADETIVENYPQWTFTDNEAYAELLHHRNKMNIQVTGDGQVGIYGARGLTTDIDEPEPLRINGHAFSTRGRIWSPTLDAIFKSPIIGHGPDTLAYYAPYRDMINMINYGMSASALSINPHNLYLDYWFTGGIFALLSFLGFCGWLLIKGLIKALKGKWQDLYFITLVPVLTFLLVSVLNDTIVGTGIILYALLGIGAVSMHKLDKSL